MRVLVAVVAALGLAGCVSLQPGAENVRLSSNAELVKGCKFLGQESIGINDFESAGIENLKKDLITKIRNKSVAMGGTDVITNGPTVTLPGPVTNITGDIYRCP